MAFKTEPCAMPAIDSTYKQVIPFKLWQIRAADREFSYSVITNRGVHAIFAGTPAGAGTDTDLTHILSGQIKVLANP
jgi:hypothetical protein